MLEFIFWKVFLKGKAFTFIRVLFMAVAAVIIITGGVMVVVVAVGIAVVVVMAPGKGFGKNPEKSSLRRKGGFPLGFLTRKGVQVGVIGVPVNILPA